MKNFTVLVISLFLSFTLLGQKKEQILKSWKAIEACKKQIHFEDTIQITKELQDCILANADEINKYSDLEIDASKYKLPIYLIKAQYYWINNLDSLKIAFFKKAQHKYAIDTNSEDIDFGINDYTFEKIRTLLDITERYSYIIDENFYSKGQTIFCSIDFNIEDTKAIIKMPSFTPIAPTSDYSFTDNGYFSNCNTLSCVNDQLVSAINSTYDYMEKRYFKVENGFVLVCKLQRIDENGKYYCEKNHIEKECTCQFDLDNITFKKNDVPFPNIIMEIFLGRNAYFRMFVFVISDADLILIPHTSKNDLTVRNWIKEGSASFPYKIGDKQPFTNKHHAECWVYEYVAHSSDKEITPLPPDGGKGDDFHLKKSTILNKIKK